MKDPYSGKMVLIKGQIIEHLKYGKKEWFDIQLEDGKVITIKKEYCELVKNK